MSSHDTPEPTSTTSPLTTGDEPTATTTDTPTEVRRKGLDDRGRVKRTRAATAYASAVALALAIILIVVLVVQNTEPVTVEFLWLAGDLPGAAALLIAAVVGALLVAIPSAVRIAQLRRALRHNG